MLDMFEKVRPAPTRCSRTGTRTARPGKSRVRARRRDRLRTTGEYGLRVLFRLSFLLENVRAKSHRHVYRSNSR